MSSIRMAGVLLGLILIVSTTGCSALGANDESSGKGRLGLKAENNPFTGEKKGAAKTTSAKPQSEKTKRSANEVTSRDLAVEQAERREKNGARVGESDDPVWFGVSTDGGCIIQHFEQGDPNDYGVVLYETDDDGENVLDAAGDPVVEDEFPELIVFRALSTLRPLDPDRIEVYTRGRKRVIDNSIKIELPGQLDAEGRDADGFFGSNVVYAFPVPEWLSQAIHNSRDQANPRAPAVRDLPAMNFYSSAAAEHFGDDQQGWLYVDGDTLGPESEDLAESTNPALEWISCQRAEDKCALRLLANNKAAKRETTRHLVMPNIDQ